MMVFRNIGKTGIAVSPITLGTMTFGSPVAAADAVRLVRYALEQGINLVDTANMYEGYNRVAGSSGGVAEEIVGKAVHDCRNQVILATKVGMKVGDRPEDNGTSPEAIRIQLERSLQRLKTDYVDIYYLHRFDETVQPIEILQALDAECRAGKFRYYGVSNYTAEQLGTLIAEADRAGLPRPVICQPPLSLLKQDALKELVPLCEREGIAVTPYQILQGGLLTGKYQRGGKLPAGSRMDEKPEWMLKFSDELFDQLEQIGSEAQAQGITMTQYALRWTLRQPAVATTIVGVKDTRQIDEAVEGLGI
jgi:aryl-alcohol dehydrogenase-like predicted oxidoreductase